MATLNKTQVLDEIEKWSKVYEFSFQFWGEANNNVFIYKGGIELASFGGEDTPVEVMNRTLEWVNKQNPKGFLKVPDRDYHLNRCGGCGARVAKGVDFCGECMCEDDGYI